MKKKRKPTHPGVIIYEHYLEPLGISIAGAARHLGVARKTLSNIINGHASVSPDMAMRLASACDTSVELWLNLQRAHDLWIMENEGGAWEDIEPMKKRA